MATGFRPSSFEPSPKTQAHTERRTAPVEVSVKNGQGAMPCPENREEAVGAITEYRNVTEPDTVLYFRRRRRNVTQPVCPNRGRKIRAYRNENTPSTEWES